MLTCKLLLIVIVAYKSSIVNRQIGVEVFNYGVTNHLLFTGGEGIT